MARDDRPAPDASGRAVPQHHRAPGRSGSSREGSSREQPPGPVRLAGALVGLQALAATAFTILVALRAGEADLGPKAAFGEAGFFLIVAVALGAVTWGLLTGRRWARTPAIVTQLLLLPVVYSLIGPSQQLVLGLATGAVVFAAFMLLISERSRAWSMGVDPTGDR